jgi:hypothetical protein
VIRLVGAAFALVAVLACTTTAFERRGYDLEGKDQNSVSCGAAVKFRYDLARQEHASLGTIEAKEPGMGMHCNQDFVLSTFLREACALKADLVNIMDEAKPDIWSSCYRATAEYIRFAKKPKGLRTDAQYLSSVGQ